jgi:hypothetical protein
LNSAGVYGYNASIIGGNGVQGLGRVGVYGAALSPNGGAGVMGVGNGANTPAGVFQGDVIVNGNFNVVGGAKNVAAEVAPNDYRGMHAEESAEVWFSDYGSAKLSAGKASVVLDPLFLRTVVVDEKHPIKVFIQMNGRSRGVYVTKHQESFDVTEYGGGRSNAEFDYRIIAKRKNFEDTRMEKVNIPAFSNR